MKGNLKKNNNTMNNKNYKYFSWFGGVKLLCIILCLINNPIRFLFDVHSYYPLPHKRVPPTSSATQILIHCLLPISRFLFLSKEIHVPNSILLSQG